MLNMIEESRKGISILTTGHGLIQEDLAGVFDAAERLALKNNIQLRIITEITPENLRIVEGMDKKFSAGKADIECRHLNLESKLFPRFLIKDEEEALLYAMAGDEPSMLKLEDEGLWINDRMFISILKGFFAQMWQTAVDAALRIDELKTGIPPGETKIIKDPDEALAKVMKVLSSAEKDVVAITSSQGINNILENDIFAKHCKRGLNCRLMAPLDLDNLEAAKKLSAYYEVRHIPINFLTMMLVDNKNLFMFKTPPVNSWTSESLFYMGDTFYTNEPRSIERVSEMLSDAWKRSMGISEITSQPGMKLPTVEVSSGDTVSKLVKAIIQNKVSSILITENNKPVGVISERDILREIVENGKDLKKTLIKDFDFTPLVALEEDQSVTEALKAMRKKGASRIAMIKNGQLVGMLTQDLSSRKEGMPVRTRVLKK
jgi:CBS domain-containing protein